jgi:DNA-binding NtrC family response regulator
MAASLDGKKILVVDDEPDIGQLAQALLARAKVDIAYTYAEAKKMLGAGAYDVVILDIMGVDGHALLNEFSGKFPCIMLTAHALTPQDLRKSVEGRAVLYLPKDELHRIERYVLKVLETPGRRSLWGWLLGTVDFRKYFGNNWMTGFQDVFKDLTEEEIIRDLDREDRP